MWKLEPGILRCSTNEFSADTKISVSPLATNRGIFSSTNRSYECNGVLQPNERRCLVRYSLISQLPSYRRWWWEGEERAYWWGKNPRSPCCRGRAWIGEVEHDQNWRGRGCGVLTCCHLCRWIWVQGSVVLLRLAPLMWFERLERYGRRELW